MQQDGTYLLAPDADEIRRLHTQAHWLDRMSDQLIARYVRPGMNCLELGCGLGSSTAAIAATLARTGRLTALDQSPVYLDYARQRLAYCGEDGVEFALGTIETYAFPDDLDFVFGRAVLHHVHDAAAAYARVAAAVRPGGLVVVEEPDMRLILAGELSDAERQLWTWYMRIGAAGGFDFGIGRELAGMALANGLVVVESAAYQPYLVTAEDRSAIPDLLHTLAGRIVAAGVASEAEVAACAAALAGAAAGGGVSPYVTFVHTVAMKPIASR